jgi:hypothetical protein
MNKSNKSILINISDISIISGDNPYKSKKDYLLELWQKHFDQDDYSKKFIKETDEQIIQKISVHHNIDLRNDLKKSSESRNTTELQSIKNDLLSKINDLSVEDKTVITKSLNNITNTTFGTNNENDIALLYNNMTGHIIIKDNKYKKKCLVKTDIYDFYIGGRIDGINKNTGSIIEIKNRVHKLFYTLRNYEKTQLMTYLYLFGVNDGQLVEAHKKKDSTEINIINVSYDEIYMEQIMNKLLKFIAFFIKFVENEDFRKMILESNDEIDF